MRGSLIFLKGSVLLMGLVVLWLCAIVLPRELLTSDLGGLRPIVIGLYIAAVPFFIALQQTWKLVGYIENNKAFSKESVKALQNIKYCAVVIGTLYALGLPYFYYVTQLLDAPGILAMALIVAFTSYVIGTAAAILQKLVEHAVAIKSENDLTV